MSVDRLLAKVPLSVVVTGSFFALTFLVYYVTTPGDTTFNNFVRLADVFLKGRLDIGQDITYLELAVKDGKFYVIPPPMPALIVLPGVALFGTALSQTLVSMIIGALTAPVVFRVLRG